MIVLRIESPRATVELRGEAGDRVLDLLDEAGSPLDVSCRAADCAACLVEVEGAAWLDAPGPAERATLADHGAGASARLACQARLLGDGGLVVLRTAATRVR